MIHINRQLPSDLLSAFFPEFQRIAPLHILSNGMFPAGTPIAIPESAVHKMKESIQTRMNLTEFAL